MPSIRHLFMRALVPGVTVGALCLGGSVAAGAATPPSAATTLSTAAHTVAPHAAVCANATQALSHVQAVKARFAAKIGKLDALEAKIRVDSRPKARSVRLRQLNKRIAHEVKLEAHVLNPKFLAQAAKAAKIAGSQCHAPASTTSSSSAPV